MKRTAQINLWPNRWQILTALIALPLISALGFANSPLVMPTNKVLLSVAGAITKTNSGNTADFDREMLLALPQARVTTTTPWTDGKPTFEGPFLRDVLAAVGAQGETIKAIALNNYSVQIPIIDAVNESAIVALKKDGEFMSIRAKGPLWIVYPWSNNPKLQSETHYGRSIWQLRSLQIQ